MSKSPHEDGWKNELNGGLIMCQNCKQLEQELAIAKNRIPYEENKYKQMYLGKINNLMSQVRDTIGIEIDCIKEVADRLPYSNNLEKEQERLYRLIRNIEKRISELK